MAQLGRCHGLRLPNGALPRSPRSRDKEREIARLCEELKRIEATRTETGGSALREHLKKQLGAAGPRSGMQPPSPRIDRRVGVDVRVGAAVPATAGRHAADGAGLASTRPTARRRRPRVRTGAARSSGSHGDAASGRPPAGSSASCDASISRFATARSGGGVSKPALTARPPTRRRRPACSSVPKPWRWSCGGTHSLGVVCRWRRSLACYEPSSDSRSRRVPRPRAALHGSPSRAELRRVVPAGAEQSSSFAG